jgi:hypothetical protein
VLKELIKEVARAAPWVMLGAVLAAVGEAIGRAVGWL